MFVIFVLRFSFRLWFSFFLTTESRAQNNQMKRLQVSNSLAWWVEETAIPKIIDRSFTMQSLTCTSQLQDFASGPYPSYPLFKLTTEASNPFQQKWGMAINFWFLLIGTCALRTHAKMVQEKSPRRLLWWASWLPEIILAGGKSDTQKVQHVSSSTDGYVDLCI